MGRGLFYLSFFLLIAGGACIAAGNVLRMYRRRERIYEGETRAKVVDLVLKAEDTYSGGFSNRYYPVFQYYANGKLCETVYPEGSYPAKWTKGQTVMIEFDPENPGLYVIKRTALRDLLPDILYWAGIGLVIAGAVLFLRFALR